MKNITKFLKLTDLHQNNNFICVAFLYVAIFVWMYFTAVVEIEGVALPQHDAGIISLAIWHGMLLLAFACAWLIHKTVDNIQKIRDYIRRIKKK